MTSVDAKSRDRYKVWAAKGSFVRRMMTRTQSSAELLILEGALASLLLSHNRDGDRSKQTNARRVSHSRRYDELNQISF